MTLAIKVSGLSLVSLVAFTVVHGCGKDKGGGDSAPAGSTTTTGTTSGTTTGTTTESTTGAPCLFLDDMTTTGMGTSTTAMATTGGTTTGGTTTGGTTSMAAGETTGMTTGGTTDGSVTTQPSIGDCINAATTGSATGSTVNATTTGSGTTGVGDTGDISPGVGIGGCAAQGRIWLPPSKTSAATCGDTLYEEVCCNDVENFYKAVGAGATTSLKAALAASVAKTPAIADVKWYGCSKSGAKYAIHGAKYAYEANGNSGVTYYTMYVDYSQGGQPSLAGQPGTCTKATLGDLGYQEAGTTTTGSGTTGGTTFGGTMAGGTTSGGTMAGGTTGGTSGTNDLSSCGIADSSDAGLLFWLTSSAATYKTWSADTSVKPAGGHGVRHKSYYNTNVKASLDANAVTHPQCSMIVQEQYENDGTTLKGYSLMVKSGTGAAEASTDGTRWFFYELPVKTAAPTAHAMNVAACTACHQRDTFKKDFVRAGPP